MASRATYYVRVDTYWQNSPDLWIGPYDRLTAQEMIRILLEMPNVWRSDTLCGGDVRDAYRVYVKEYTATKAKKEGMKHSVGLGSLTKEALMWTYKAYAGRKLA